MSRTRRVGGLTLGVSLVIFGLLFLFKTLVQSISYSVILKFWPCILILLGCEVLASYLLNREEEYKFDGFSLVILIGMSLFSIVMAGMDILVKYLEVYMGTI